MKKKARGTEAKNGQVKLNKKHEDFLREFGQMAKRIRGCTFEELRENIAGMLEMLMRGFYIQLEGNQKNFDELRDMTLKYIGGEFNKRQEIWEQHLEAAEHQVQQNSAALMACLLRTYVIEQCLINKGVAKDKEDCRDVSRIPRDELSGVLDLFGWGIEDLNRVAQQANRIM